MNKKIKVVLCEGDFGKWIGLTDQELLKLNRLRQQLVKAIAGNNKKAQDVPYAALRQFYAARREVTTAGGHILSSDEAIGSDMNDVRKKARVYNPELPRTAFLRTGVTGPKLAGHPVNKKTGCAYRR